MPDKPTELPANPSSGSEDSEVNHRILVVDDNPAIHEDFRKILVGDPSLGDFDAEEEDIFGTPEAPGGHPDFALDFASQGDQALATVTKAIDDGTPYSLVFMDVRMPPGWDGIETTARLWEVDPDLQVVICTAYSDYSWEKMIDRLGKTDRLLILKKPFETIEVFQIAHALTTKWTLQQASRLNAESLALAVKERTEELELEMAVRKRSEEALKFTRFSVEHASDAMFWVAPDSSLTYANAAVCHSLGYSVNELLLLSVVDIIPGIRDDGWISFWESLREEKQRTFESRHLTKDGREIPIELTANFFDYDGRESICASARDITRRHQILAELAEARDAALESSRQKSRFLANMSHEIRTPMNGVIGMGELLFLTDLDREQREYVDAIRGSADHLLEIINDILDSSKIESGQMKFETVRFDLRELVESTLDVVSPAACGKGLEVAACTPPDECNILRGDPGRLKQVLTNLVGNAVKFTERGGVSLIVSVAEEAPDEVLLGFAVRDTGIGIDAAAQQEIFEPFHQADGSNSRKYGGTGLGLTISRQIIEALGGRLEVDSEPGVGSEFRFTLRLEKSETPSDTAEPLAAELENLRVLVVDDNATVRDILRRQLTNLRTRPVAVAGGREALEFLRAAAADGAPVSIAIVDMQMPAMDGIALAKLIKAEPPIASTRLIMLSSLGDRLPEPELLEAGVGHSIVKPVKQSRLRDSLVTMLTGRTEASSKQGAATEDAPRQSVRILLAEDNRVNQQVALLQLKRLGYGADLAANGSEALAALERVPYDVVLMDCQMPGMDGYEATRRIRELHQRPIHIIAMTANAMDGDREKCLEAGMDEHLGKPVHIDDLRRLLGEWTPPAAVANADDPPPVDLDRLTEVTGTDSGMFRRITNDYLDQAEEILALLGEAIEKHDGGEIRQLAHKLGGSSASCGMVAMEESLSRLEQMEASFQPQAAGALYQEAAGALFRVRRFLSARLQSPDLDP